MVQTYEAVHLKALAQVDHANSMFAKIINNTGVRPIGEWQLLICHDVPSKVQCLSRPISLPSYPLAFLGASSPPDRGVILALTSGIKPMGC
jgi:hypothetical protein